MFCCWKGSLLLVEDECYVSEFRLCSREKWALDFHSKCLLPSKYETYNAINVVRNSSLGCKVPFILTTRPITSASQLRTKTYDLLMYCMGSLSVFGHFAVPKSSTPTNPTGFFLLDGPLIIWSEECSIHTVHGIGGEMSHDVINIQHFIKGFTGGNIRHLWVFDTEDNKVLLFMKLVVNTQRTSDIHEHSMQWICAEMQTYEGRISLSILSASLFVPSDYGLLAKCVNIQRTPTLDARGGDFKVKSNIFVGTSYNQVVVFENGFLLQCITTQNTPQNVVPLKTPFSGMMMAVQLETGDVSCYNVTKTECDQVKSLCQYKGVSSIICGDFANLGYDQLLMLTDEGVSENKLIVTDFHHFNTEAKSEAVLSYKTCPKSLLSAVKVLELRTHSGETCLSDRESEMQLKSNLLRNSQLFLSSLGCGENVLCTTSDSEASLICAIRGKCGDYNSSVYKCNDVTADLDVTCLWQRFIDRHWTVGMIVKNTSVKSIHSFGCSLVCLSKEPMDSFSKVFQLNDARQFQSSGFTPSTKKPKLDTETITDNQLLDILWSDQNHPNKNISDVLLPGEEMCVVLSVLTSVSIIQQKEAVIVARYRLMSDENSLMQVREICQITFSFGQVCQRQYNCDKKCLHLWKGKMELRVEDLETKAGKDLVSVQLTKSSIMIDVHSTFTNLLRLPSILKVKMPFLEHISHLLGDDLGQQDLFLSSSGDRLLGDGLAMHISSSATTVTIMVLYKCIAQLTILVALLKQYLPEDICLTLHGADNTKMLLKMITAVRKEVHAKKIVLHCS